MDEKVNTSQILNISRDFLNVSTKKGETLENIYQLMLYMIERLTTL